MGHKVVRAVQVMACGAAVVVVGSAFSAAALPARPTAPDPTIAPCDGVTVVLDERALGRTGDGGYELPRSTCVPTDSTITAQAALNASSTTATGTTGVTGTADAGPAVVCRVNENPNATMAIAKPGGGLYFENCATTPPDYAHWTVWHRSAGSAWDDTGQDITALNLAPGDAVALVFTYRSEPTTLNY